MNGKTYWVGRNLKFHRKLILNREPFILDLVQANDDRVCLQYDRAVCFMKNKEGIDPKSKMKQITQELKRGESELRKKRVEQERMKTLSGQYEQLEKRYADRELPAPDQNLLI